MDGILNHFCSSMSFVQGAVAIHGDMHVNKSMCTRRAYPDSVGVHDAIHGSSNLFHFFSQSFRSGVQ